MGRCPRGLEGGVVCVARGELRLEEWQSFLHKSILLVALTTRLTTRACMVMSMDAAQQQCRALGCINVRTKGDISVRILSFGRKLKEGEKLAFNSDVNRCIFRVGEVQRHRIGWEDLTRKS